MAGFNRQPSAFSHPQERPAMNRLAIALGALLIAFCGASGANAQTQMQPYYGSPPTVAGGPVNKILVDTTHGLPVTSTPPAPGTIIGTVDIDQATPGTTNGVVVNSSALPTGAASAANQTPTQAPVAPATATATKSDLIGCQATSAAINPTTGQQAAIDCDLNNNLLVSSGGAPNYTTSQVAITTASTAVCTARALRRTCTITAITGAQQVFCSGTVATTANGQLIPAVVGATLTVSTTAAINCIAVSATQTVSVAEVY